MSSGINCREIFVFLDILIWNQTKRRNRQNNNDNNNNNSSSKNCGSGDTTTSTTANLQPNKPNYLNQATANRSGKADAAVKVIKCKNSTLNHNNKTITKLNANNCNSNNKKHNNNNDQSNNKHQQQQQHHFNDLKNQIEILQKFS
ncbi:uncharacterized protein [Musca autumnalis]|uniref:uncharacterized protein n=1 Tax=Musca autumnalis TaxID=221902 RepID=UPI003CEDDD1C